MSIYLLFRAGQFLHAFRKLRTAQEFFPGTWEPVYNGPIRIAEEWNLGDAKIITAYLQD